MKFEIKIPLYVKQAMDILEQAGFEGYAVGGCIRDSLLGKAPSDWDMCTNALPEMVCELFDRFTVAKTGLKHGTVTVIIDKNPIEITTYRKDVGYSDNRRPDEVSFVGDIREDLSRRDFTVNAMAYSEKTGIIDLFGGEADLKAGLVRCVGDPHKRFEEDALRILRAVRFASALGFKVEENTASAVHSDKKLLENISAERIRDELLKLICGRDAGKVLTDFRDVVAVAIPELAETFDFKQHNPHHCFDVYKHIVTAVENIEPTPVLRITMLLHDIAKPRMYCPDENGIGHFHAHPAVGAEMADKILRRLKFDNKTRHYVTAQIADHDNRFSPSRKSVKRFIALHGYDFFFDHINVRFADTLAQSEFQREQKLAELEQKLVIGKQLFAEESCLALKDLAIDGRDLIDAGFVPGKAIKEALSACLEEVVEERLPNEKNALMEFAKNNYLNG